MLMTEITPEAPRVFISYSWSSPDYEKRVVTLAEQLARDGVHVIFDKWDLREGNDKYEFMERSINDPQTQKVLLLCDAEYARKANARDGGVGAESQIISPHIYTSVSQDKFIPVLMEVDQEGKPYLPVFVKTRIYIDLSSPEREGEEYERLLRAIYNRPFYVRPPVGTRPTFAEDNTTGSAPVNALLRNQFHDAVLRERAAAPALLDDYLQSLLDLIRAERIPAGGDFTTFSENTVASIVRLRPVRDAFVDVLQFIAKYESGTRFGSHLHKFFESTLTLIEPDEGAPFFPNGQGNNISFLTWELLLYVVATFVRAERFALLAEVLNTGFVRERRSSNAALVSYTVFDTPLAAIDDGYKRVQKLTWISTSSQLVKEHVHPPVTFGQLIEADFLLMLRSVLLDEKPGEWYPRTLVYASNHGPFTTLIRAQSRSYFDRLRVVFGVENRDEFTRLVREASIQKRFPRVEGAMLGSLEDLVGIRELGNR